MALCVCVQWLRLNYAVSLCVVWYLGRHICFLVNDYLNWTSKRFLSSMSLGSMPFIYKIPGPILVQFA